MSQIHHLQPWYWRSLPLERRTGSQVFDCLFRHAGTIATLLESPYPTPEAQPQLARYSICAGMPRTHQGNLQMWTPSVGEILPFLRRLLSSQPERLQEEEKFYPPFHLPFTGGWLGWLGYDLAWEIERLPRLKPDPLPFPVAFWYEPATFAVLDHVQQTLYLAATHESELDRLHQRLEHPSPSCLNYVPLRYHGFTSGQCPATRSPSHVFSFLTTQTDFEAAVVRAKKYIQAGDIFQANLSLRFEAATSADSWSIYRALQQINPSPFASYWQTPWGDMMSCSPERLVQLQGRQAQTRPIAGTRSRGTTDESDRQLAQELIANAKERAEHIMLVDLERNDLGRVCEWGSVEVNELFAIERYSHVMHLVSNVTGILRGDRDAVDLIRALFPGGTISGCPKVRAMEIIEELEPVRRSLFYGSCGYIDRRGHLDLNILIRTLLASDRTTGVPIDETSRNTGDSALSTPLKLVSGQVGAGIVADSDPEKEWYESLHKAQAQLSALKALSF
ncbi:MAG: anthranilate synthase component I [Coleofasciculaceae cyanobacterium]